MALMEEDFLFSLNNVRTLITLMKIELQNYQTRIEEVLNRTIETIAGRAYKKVDQLPSSGSTAFIYLVPNNDTEENNVFDEYFWDPDRSKFELFGTTKVKLDEYLKIVDIKPLENLVTSLSTRTSSLETDVTSLETIASSLETNITSLSTRASSLETSTTNLINNAVLDSDFPDKSKGGA